MERPALTHVFAFTSRRAEIVLWLEETLGIQVTERRDDSDWFATAAATFVVHDREDEPSGSSVVAWFHVPDIGAAYERVSARGSAAGPLRDGYFFARDPEGRVFGVRSQPASRSATGRT